MGAFQKVSASDKVRRSATEHNAFIDAALDFQQRARSSTPAEAPGALPPGMIRVRNDSGADRGKYAALAISGVLATTSGNANQLRNAPVVTGITPDPDTNAHQIRLVVLADPVKSGKIGRAWVDGPAIASVDVTNASHTAATIDAAHRLISAASGPVRLIWSPGTGVNDCLVILGAGAGELATVITDLEGDSTGVRYKKQDVRFVGEKPKSDWIDLLVFDDCENPS